MPLRFTAAALIAASVALLAGPALAGLLEEPGREIWDRDRHFFASLDGVQFAAGK